MVNQQPKTPGTSGKGTTEMTTTETANPPPWTGWHRGGKRQPWRAVVQTETESAAWSALLDQAALGGEKAVLPSGRHPNDRHLSSTVPEFHR